MKIFITGGTGSLGVYIVKYLRKAGYTDLYLLSRKEELPSYLEDEKEHLNIVKGDICDMYPLYDVLKDMDVVIHAAAEVSFDERDEDKMSSINVKGTTQVVNACLDNEVTKLIHVSSVAAIGRAAKGGMITEKTEWVESDYNSHYGVTKHSAEMEAWRGHAEGLQVSVVNPSIILGAGDWNRGSFAMFKKLHKGVPYYTSGSTAIVDVRDVARFIVRLINEDQDGERFLLTGTNVSFQELFKLMSNALGSKAPTKPLPMWMGSLFTTLERWRSKVTGSTPIITRESLVAASHDSRYDKSKSLSLEGFSYTPLSSTIEESAAIYLSGEKKLLEI